MSILDKIVGAERDVDPREKLSWHYEMKERRPDDFKELIEVIADWKNRGDAREKFPTMSSLHRFLSGEDHNRLDPPFVNCGYQAFARFVRAWKP